MATQIQSVQPFLKIASRCFMMDSTLPAKISHTALNHWLQPRNSLLFVLGRNY
ncbi:hypothetical protein OROMI_029940 [Orobanche minor]